MIKAVNLLKWMVKIIEFEPVHKILAKFKQLVKERRGSFPCLMVHIYRLVVFK